MGKLINETKTAVIETLDCTENSIDALRTVVEYQITVAFLYEKNKKDSSRFDSIADIVNGAITGTKHIPIPFTRCVKTTVMAAIGSGASVGGDVYSVAYKASFGAISGASSLTEDLDATAVAVVEGAIEAAEIIDADAGKILEGAVAGTLDAAGKIGSDIALFVREALVSAPSLPVDKVAKALEEFLK